MKKGVGDIFQQETKYKRGELPAGGLDWTSRPAPYKRYTDVPTISLPAPACDQRKPFWEVIQNTQKPEEF